MDSSFFFFDSLATNCNVPYDHVLLLLALLNLSPVSSLCCLNVVY